jgi:D-glycero-beta-D-manno-heptose 1-phosphate adenylyltransferase
MSFHKQLRDKIVSREIAAKNIEALRDANKKIVFTNGCFDILHPGHVDYLSQARDLGDFLVLGLNTDDSVRRQQKAPGRPVNNEVARAIVLAGLSCVDRLIFFSEDTPLELITFLQPDILVKGNDYAIGQVVGREVVEKRGGKVVTIPLLEGYSTTGLIRKINSTK